MKGNPEVVAVLQSALALEATIHLQYGTDARCLREVGLKRNAKKAAEFGGDSGKFLGKVEDRVLFLEGSVAYAPTPVMDSSSVTAMLQRELGLEMGIVEPYERAVVAAQQALDDTTRNLFEHLLKWHQEHVDHLERELGLITKLGEAGYFAARMR
jgi:bacterioferritin